MDEIINNISQEYKSKVKFDEGIGRAIFDTELEPEKRYFLEKSWNQSGDVLTIILTNPSPVGSLSSDNTVNFLLRFAIENSYSGIYIINIIPYIGNKFHKIKKERGEEGIIEAVHESPNIESFKYAINRAEKVILAWGKEGQTYFENLITNNKEIKNLFIDENMEFEAFGFSERRAFPYHPLPNERENFSINSSDLIDATPFLDVWLNR